MGLKIDPSIALKSVNGYLNELDEFSYKNHREGFEKISELKVKIDGFLNQAFDDYKTKHNNLYNSYPSRKSPLERIIAEQKRIRNVLIGCKEEISVLIASKKALSSSDPSSDENIKELLEILEDLQLLVKGCEESLNEDVSVSLINNVREYNRILLRLKDLGYFDTFDFIEEELEAKGLMKLKPFELAKVREVISESKKLINRIQNIIKPSSAPVELVLEQIFSNFHKVAHQLKRRHKENGKPRNTLEIKDEYDVQDLLHSLLRLFFDDVRAEQVTPDYATKSSRIDFILKAESAAIEVKFVREEQDRKRIADELIVDMERYKEHPNVDSIYCFVYDHNKEILNPAEIEELSGKREIDVFVYVRPKL